MSGGVLGIDGENLGVFRKDALEKKRLFRVSLDILYRAV